jgi:hypothetical protein
MRGDRLTWLAPDLARGSRTSRAPCRSPEPTFPSLQNLRQTSSYWRLESGADDLIRILKNRDGTGDAPENSMFNPKNAAYILKRGYAGR